MAEVSFGEWLKRRRSGLGLTQEQLAQQINCSTSALRKVEAEERRPSVQVVERLIAIFDIPQNERKSFLRFARGDWQALAKPDGKTENVPWYTSSIAPRSNLPASITSFIGREKEQNEIISLLAKNRLVTLAGVGGIGKTRLALQVANELLDRFQDGIWFIELAPITDSKLVANTVGGILGVRAESDRPLMSTLMDWFSDRELLIILDNCEHLLDACARFIDSVLRGNTKLQILATSREALGIAGESVYHVPSLQVPNTKDQLEIGQLEEYASVQLFAQRAAQRLSTFKLTSANAPEVGKICHQLDGIPLAIELAAARVRAMSVGQIVERLDDRFLLLTGGSRTALPRQQTLRSLIDWSHNLLTNSEKICFRRLSIFTGGWTLAAAESVCSYSGGGIESGEILDLLTQLVDKSLVIVDDQPEESRYHMLETIRQYAHEKLMESGEIEQLNDQHLSFFLTLAESAEATYLNSKWVEWIPRLEMEHGNLRAALEWACARDMETARWLAGLLRWFWYWGDHCGEAQAWYARVLGLGEGIQTKGYAMALFGAGMIATVLMDLDRAQLWLEQCISVLRVLENQQCLADALIWLAYSMILMGHAEQACLLFEENESFIRRSASPFNLSVALSDWGRALANARHDYSRAQALQDESIAVARAGKDALALGTALMSRGYLATQQGDYHAAQQYHSESLACRRQVGTRWLVVISSQNVADMMRLLGDYSEVHSLYQEALNLSREIGDQQQIAWTLYRLGYLAVHQNEHTQAARHFIQSLEICRTRKNERGVAICLAGFAELRRVQGRMAEAVRLLASVETWLQDSQPLPIDHIIYNHSVAAVRAQVDEAVFAAAWEAGRNLSLDEAIAYVLEEI